MASRKQRNYLLQKLGLDKGEEMKQQTEKAIVQLDQLDEQIRKQVEAWKLEVETNRNFLVGMMLSAAHPKIVTYTLTSAEKFGPRPMGVKFQWNEPKGATDPKVSKEMLAAAIMATVGEEDPLNPGELGPAGEALMKAVLEQQAKEGQAGAKLGGAGYGGIEAEIQIRKLEALEQQKAEWARKEREIAEAFGGMKTPGFKLKVPQQSPMAKEYPGGTQVYIQFRGFSKLGPFALDFSGITKSTGTPGQMGLKVDETLQRSIDLRDFNPGEFDESGHGFKAYSAAKYEGLIAKMFDRFSDQTMKPQSVRELPNGAILVTMTN